MLADFVINGIDSIFNKKLNLQTAKAPNKPFSKQTVKDNLNNVVRRRDRILG